MVQIPAPVRPYVTAFLKLHFWLLAGLVPLVLLPLLFAAQGSIADKIQSRRGKVEGALSSIKAIFNNQPHPNAEWVEQIGKRTRQINDETLQAWEQLWKAQEPLRVWPEILGVDFVNAVASLPAGGDLRRSLRERYQNEIRAAPRQLPVRMGVDDVMGDPPLDDQGRPVEPSQPEKEPSLAQWNHLDQEQLFQSFNWDQLPSTTQIMMAQEELWMYGVICDVIRRVNATPVAADAQAVLTPVNVPIPFIEELKVGYLAAEDDPGGRSSSRILRIERSGGGMPDESLESSDSFLAAEGQPAVRPGHPRFGGPAGPGPGPSPADARGAEDTDSPDDALKNWVYVDFDGKPIMARDLESHPTNRMLRLMPFLIRAVIDQRALDRLLIELASAPVLIDTRQVRINAAGPTGQDPGRRGPAAGNTQSASVGRPKEDLPRLHDVNLELRGTLTLVLPPNPSSIGKGRGGGREEGTE